MNYRQVVKILCLILRCIGLLMLLPAVVGLVYHESSAGSFFLTSGILLAVSCVTFFFKPRDKSIYAREGFVIVALSWLLMGVFGALPFVISGAIPNFVDAFFEIVSGFTTTGASVVTNVEALPRCMLFWRCFSIWIGGMGVLVFLMAILPLAGGRDMHLLRAEAPGPSVGKLVPKMRRTAMLLYGMYIVLTIIEIVLLLAGGMHPFDAVTHAFSNAGTGGFGNYGDGISHFDSAYIDIVITVFMLLFSVNFNLYYLILLRQVRDAFKDEELRWFLVVLALSLVVVMSGILPLYDSFASALRYGSFQVASIVSTTGFATADFSRWPMVSQAALLFLMFMGGCAGSTAGGIKCSRFVILVKSVFRELRRTAHPRSVSVLKMGGQTVDEETVSTTTIYLLTYLCILIFGFLLVSFNGYDFTTTFTAVLTCLNNVGPGLGAVVGPMGSFAPLSALSKIVLSVLMLIGRLEIFPVLMLFVPGVWRKRRKN